MYILCERKHSEKTEYFLYKKNYYWNLLTSKSSFGRIAFSSLGDLCDSLHDPEWGGNSFVADRVIDGTYNRLAEFSDWSEVLRIRETHPELFI